MSFRFARFPAYELVQVDDTVLRILVHEQAHHVAANKSGTAGNQYVTFECSHNGKDFKFFATSFLYFCFSNYAYRTVGKCVFLCDNKII